MPRPNWSSTSPARSTVDENYLSGWRLSIIRATGNSWPMPDSSSRRKIVCCRSMEARKRKEGRGKRKVSAGLIARRRRLPLRLDAGGLDNRPPFIGFGLVIGRERFRRLPLARHDLLADIAEPLAHGGIGQRFDRRGIELGNDLGRRSFRHPQRMPGRNVQARQSRLIDRRNIGRNRRAAARGDGIALDRAAADLRHCVGRLIEQQIDAPCQQILHRRRQPAIRHDLDFRAGLLLEQKARHLIGAAGACRAALGRICPSASRPALSNRSPEYLSWTPAATASASAKPPDRNREDIVLQLIEDRASPHGSTRWRGRAYSRRALHARRGQPRSFRRRR